MPSSSELYRERFREVHGTDAPPVWTIDFLYMEEDRERARTVAEEYMSNYYLTVSEHYETRGSHFKGLKGYEYYQAGAQEAQRVGRRRPSLANSSTRTPTETPQDVIARIEHRRSVIGDHVALFAPSFAGLPYDAVEPNPDLFATQVIPYFRGA